MNYLGPKIKLSSFIYNVISNSVEQKLSDCSLCDLFAGTGIIGNYFHDKVKSVIYNDREYYSFIINSAFYSKVSDEKYREMLAELNQLDGREGLSLINIRNAEQLVGYISQPKTVKKLMP
ncbi:DNA adenine methylase [Chryseobacterium indoltheticum]|uniref:DNA adenine methylase n=1 Tax=Chryseobacterium indoltheticum TaxID=254 RepID=UPI0019145484|nr:DNA adenine methylase [Chryseobacterium indoltheticum]QQQ28900.1 DNA adenine methylase [Chryseobacterium indoltheticum]